MAKRNRLFARRRRPPADDVLHDSGGGQRPPVAHPPTQVIFDPGNPDFVHDPYPTFAALREHDPVHRSPMGSWVLTRYEDVAAALADERLGNAPPSYAVLNSRNSPRYVCAEVANNIIPFKDAPAHTQPRKLISRAFHQHLKQSPLDIGGMARQLLEAKRGVGEIDIVSEFSTPLSVSVLCQLLGISERDIPQLKRWSEWFFYLFSIIPSEAVRTELDQQLRAFRAFFADLVGQRRQQPGDDLISALLAAGREGGGLSEVELIDTCLLLFADGANADAGLVNAVATLLSHPEQLQLLRDNPALMPQAVTECLRYESPSLFIGRIAREDLTLNGNYIRKDASVLLMLASANRDPAQFDHPDRFDITRQKNPLLSFGQGQHACVGRALVFREIEAALRVLLSTLPELALKNETRLWTPRLGHRWLSELRVMFQAF